MGARVNSRRMSLPRLACLALGGLASLAGCASAPPIRQDGALIPPDLAFTMNDGAVLPARVWPARTPERAVILALHGFGDSRDAWEHSAPRLAAGGLTVYAYDQRGFGAAPGRGHWAGTGRMVEDAATVEADVARANPGVPLYVMGESMGGAVAMVLAARAAPSGGTILLAPAVWGRGEMNPAVVASLDIADAVAPAWHLTGREIPLGIVVTDDRAELIRLARDPLTLPGSSVDLLAGLVDLMTRAQRAAPGLKGPVLIAYGAHDDLVPPQSMMTAWDKMPAQDRRAYYANEYHLMLRDRDHRAVEQDIVSWIVHPGWPLPSGADVQAAGWQAQGGTDVENPPALPTPDRSAIQTARTRSSAG